MFGPNSLVKTSLDTNICHRDIEFNNLLKNYIGKFKKVFDLHNYDVLFVPGSATLGMQILIKNFKYNIDVIGCEGKFKNRWKSICSDYNKLDSSSSIKLYCQLETSCSTFNNDVEYNYETIIDATSSFPYYDIPKNCIAFVTCSNKLLGSLPGLSIICVRKDCWNYFKQYNNESYLNLYWYKQCYENYLTPTTFPVYIIEHMNKILCPDYKLKIKTKIKTVYDYFIKYLGIDKSNILFNPIVISIPKDICDINVAEKYQLYGVNTDSKYIQIFTYSYDNKSYCDFIKEEVLCKT